MVGFAWGVGLYSIHSAILYTCCHKGFTCLACILSGEWEGPHYLAHGTAMKQWSNPCKALGAETGTQWANSAGLTATCWAAGPHWQPTPGFLPGETHGRRSLVGYGPWGCRELDTTEQLHFTTWLGWELPSGSHYTVVFLSIRWLQLFHLVIK